MQLSEVCCSILDQLGQTIRQVDEKDFCSQSRSLGNSTIGQHLRHTLEYFICLEQGIEDGIVNYDKRPHNTLIESDKQLALKVMTRITDFVSRQKADVQLTLEVGYEKDSETYYSIRSNYFRELTYTIEHAVHHMAIMKIGIREVAPYVEIPPDFGIAVSTIRYRDTLVAAR